MSAKHGEYKTKKNDTENPLLQHIPRKDGIFHPRSIGEVKELIDFARSNNCVIRTLGSQHSPTLAIYDEKNERQIKLILDGELRGIKSIEPNDSKDFATVSVGAGCYLGVNPRDKSSTKENSFNFRVDKVGYALPTLGGISHQTIAGFLQTSSSGGSAKYGIADAVEAIEWINGKGEICQAKKGDDIFNAAVVSMGLFGIITNVTFKLPKKYLVEGVEENKELNDSFLAKDPEGHYTALHNALFKDHEYIHINWLAQKYIGRTMQWVGKRVDPTKNSDIRPYNHPLNSTFMTLAACLALVIGNLIDRVGSNCKAAKYIKAQLLKLFADPNDKQEFCDDWHKTLPIDDQADVDGLIKTVFSEIWFPGDQDTIDKVMEKLNELFAAHPEAAGNFIVELYCAKQSPYWLSPSYGHDAIRVDLYWWQYNMGDPDKYFGLFWDALLNIPGARLHWGKVMPTPGKKYGDTSFTVEHLYRNYPQFPEWLKLREGMDPQQLFVTDYWRRVFHIPA